MPPWLSAFLVLCIVVAFGTYVIYGTEGFATAQLQCKLDKATCENKCGSSNAACFTACGDVATKCYATAVAAATVSNIVQMTHRMEICTGQLRREVLHRFPCILQTYRECIMVLRVRGQIFHGNRIHRVLRHPRRHGMEIEIDI
jgi:hypothetical protein